MSTTVARISPLPAAALALVERSISHTEIAHAPYTHELATGLSSECEDSARNGSTEEYWGTHRGSEWRVHLDRCQA